MQIASINGLSPAYAKNIAAKKQCSTFKGSSLGGGLVREVVTEGAKAAAEASTGSILGSALALLGAGFSIAKFQQDQLGEEAAYKYAMDRIMMDITYG